MKTASVEVRTIVIKAYASGISRQQIADIVGYHLNSVSRWIREFQRENRLKAHQRGHRASIFSEEERGELIELIGKVPDITLEEIRAHFTKTCSLNAIHKLLKTLGFVFKKNTEGQRARTRRYSPIQGRLERISKGYQSQPIDFPG
jgi:transposase